MLINKVILGDCLTELKNFNEKTFQLIIADPPYFQVLLEEEWDNQWKSEEDYLDWSIKWIKECRRVLKDDGLLYIFGQLGKREHVWLHLTSRAANVMQFHDMIIWDRAVGYNERGDSFTPCYEMILMLRKNEKEKPYFNKNSVRIPYDDETIKSYLNDKRYKDKTARLEHLQKGKYATNILRVPSLKGSSKEKAGHPSQKPIRLIEYLILSSSRENDIILDPFMGSGTTAVVSEINNRKWVGIEINPLYVKMADERLKEIRFFPEFPLYDINH